MRGWVLLSILSFSIACGADEPAPPAPSASSTVARPASVTTAAATPEADAARLTETARLLAGLEVPEGPDAALWQRHRERMDALWQRLEERHLDALRAFAAAEVVPLVAAPEAPLFYPFGGPDFLAAQAFYPAARTWVLVGLQPPGQPPRLEGMDLGTQLGLLAGSFSHLADEGYFVTTEMDRDYGADSLGGVAAALYVLAARSGYRLTGVRAVTLGGGGELLDAAPGEPAPGIALDVVADGDPTPRTLLYLAYDLSDQGFATHPEFARYLEGTAPWNVFMKSAEFLLHMPDFGVLHDLLLAEAASILEDDSGLPFKSFDPDVFALRYFGVYTESQPAAYRKWLQPDLVAAFAAADTEPLPFAVGYHGQIDNGCLIYAERRAAP